MKTKLLKLLMKIAMVGAFAATTASANWTLVGNEFVYSYSPSFATRGVRDFDVDTDLKLRLFCRKQCLAAIDWKHPRENLTCTITESAATPRAIGINDVYFAAVACYGKVHPVDEDAPCA